MKELRKKLELNKLDYYKTHLSLINPLLPVKMTPKEVEVLAGFMSLEGDIAKYRFSKTGRKIIMEQLELSPSGLSNYLGTLEEKEFIRKIDSNNYIIWPLLIPEKDEQLYIFKIVNNGQDPPLIIKQESNLIIQQEKVPEDASTGA